MVIQPVSSLPGWGFPHRHTDGLNEATIGRPMGAPDGGWAHILSGHDYRTRTAQALGLVLWRGALPAALAQTSDPGLALRPSQPGNPQSSGAAPLTARDQELEATRAQQKQSAETEMR